ncbi:MAG: alpha/beta fold hydrolase [Myxococcota bacterium]|nr:alpha/beta fold hydrolase [Myxococcota bacterium]
MARVLFSGRQMVIHQRVANATERQTARFIASALTVPLFVLAACGTSAGPGSVPASADGGSNSGDGAAQSAGGPIGGSRPTAVHVPPSYVAGTPMPLVVLLHGYGASGAIEDAYLGLTALSDSRGFLYAHPDGTTDSSGLKFWNATDACCDIHGAAVDDSTYLSDLIQQIAARYAVDSKRVFLFGHSNGGFMAYRMACDHGDQIAAIVSVAGAMWNDVSRCPAKTTVSVLEVHGTSDATIVFTGGANQGHDYPGAQSTVNDWVTIDGCATTPDTSAPALDLDSTIPGAETTVSKYQVDCKPGGAAQLWTMQGSGHIPAFNAGFGTAAIDFLYAHPKP